MRRRRSPRFFPVSIKKMISPHLGLFVPLSLRTGQSSVRAGSMGRRFTFSPRKHVNPYGTFAHNMHELLPLNRRRFLLPLICRNFGLCYLKAVRLRFAKMLGFCEDCDEWSSPTR